MFNIPATVTTSVVSCRSFVSLTNFTPNDVYVYPAGPHPARFRAGGSGNGVIQAHTSYGCGGAKDNSNKRGGGKSIAGIAFRSMGAGAAESMDQAYCMDELTARRGITPDMDRKSRHDFGDASEPSGVLVHIATIVERDGVAQRETHEDETDLEKAESLSHGHKSFVPRV
jgi:hypothetical protein